jgi:hypothetical protein
MQRVAIFWSFDSDVNNVSRIVASFFFERHRSLSFSSYSDVEDIILGVSDDFFD